MFFGSQSERFTIQVEKPHTVDETRKQILAHLGKTLGEDVELERIRMLYLGKFVRIAIASGLCKRARRVFVDIWAIDTCDMTWEFFM